MVEHHLKISLFYAQHRDKPSILNTSIRTYQKFRKTIVAHTPSFPRALVRACPGMIKAGGNPVLSEYCWMPVFTGMTNQSFITAFYSLLP
jgi:hypothetical protein